METKKYKVVVDGYTDLVECDSVNFHKSGTVYFLSQDNIIGSAPPQAYVMLETTDKKVFADKLIEELCIFLNKEQLKNDYQIKEFLKEGYKMDGVVIHSRVQKNQLVEELNVLINDLIHSNNAKSQS